MGIERDYLVFDKVSLLICHTFNCQVTIFGVPYYGYGIGQQPRFGEDAFRFVAGNAVTGHLYPKAVLLAFGARIIVDGIAFITFVTRVALVALVTLVTLGCVTGVYTVYEPVAVVADGHYRTGLAVLTVGSVRAVGAVGTILAVRKFEGLAVAQRYLDAVFGGSHIGDDSAGADLRFQFADRFLDSGDTVVQTGDVAVVILTGHEHPCRTGHQCPAQK